MRIFHRSIIGAILIAVVFAQLAWAAESSVPTLNKVRFSQRPEQVRIVFDMDFIGDYKATLEQNPFSLIVDMTGHCGKDVMPQMVINDPIVDRVTIKENPNGKTQAVIDLKAGVVYKVFTLKAPNRLVIDIIKNYEYNIEENVDQGITYKYWLRGSKAGPLAIHILDVNTKEGNILRPVLSNEMIPGLETVARMAERVGAVAAVNGSYFSPQGEILGVLKIDKQIISSSYIARSAVGVMPDGSFVIDQMEFNSSVKPPDGETIVISGVNCERSDNGLILYNDAYGLSTGTNAYGTEYVIIDGKVAGIATGGNSSIPPGAVVLSAHGTAAKSIERLKIGDQVVITQSLGRLGDEAVHVLGAGPTLVKNGNIYLTTKIEEFGSDVAGGRAPRTALGTTKDGHLLLVVVDGRAAHSIGMTLLDLAQLMTELGANEALNLDGGGSSEMVVKGKIVNKPSDGKERPVGTALAVLR